MRHDAEGRDRGLAVASPPDAGLRVLHCYAGNLYGGIESMLLTLARQRAEAPGLIPEYALCFEERLADELRSAGAVVHRLDPVRFSRPWTILRARRRLARLLAADPPDLVICHACWPHALFAPVARRAGLPLAFWMHDAAAGAHWIERRASATPPDLVLVNSRYTAATLPRLFPGIRHEVVYCPVAPPVVGDRAAARAEVRRELGASPGTAVIVQASRLERWKGQSALIAALARLRDQDGWAAWLVGGAQRPHEQAYLDELRAEARAAGIDDRVRFLGQRADVPRLLAGADIHCQANTGPEPFGIAFVEALYAALPVVATRLGGAVEIVDGSCGVLVPPADLVALADALSRLIADPAARARLGSAGPGRAAYLCDPAAVMGQLHGLLADVVESRRIAP